MALNLEKRADDTYYFRRTQIKEGKQKAQRDLISNTRDLQKLEVHNKLEEHRQTEHARNIELINLQIGIFLGGLAKPKS